MLLPPCPCCTLHFDTSVPLLPGKDFSWHITLGSHHGHLYPGRLDKLCGWISGKLPHTDFRQFDSPWEVLLAADRSLCTKSSIWLLSWSFWLLLLLLQQQLFWIPSYFSPGKWLHSEIPRMGIPASPVGCKEGLLHLAAQVCYWSYPGLIFLS